MATAKPNSISSSLEDNLKKALTELLLLHLLTQKECYIGELTDILRKKSHGTLSIIFPYAAIYRLLQSEYIAELPKRNAPDGRRRQYYGITKKGNLYLQQLLRTYTSFSKGVADILEGD